MNTKFQEDVWLEEMGQGQTGQVLMNLFINSWQTAPGVSDLHSGTENSGLDRNDAKPFYVNVYQPGSEKEIVRDEKPAADTLRKPETVLFVDDEEMITELAEDLLGLLGYRVLIAGSGKEAVEIFEQNRDAIDMVILDVVMPNMNGVETYDRIKNINPRVKVLLSSGYGDIGQATEIMDRGCNGFIQKPFKVKQLSRKMRDILDKN